MIKQLIITRKNRTYDNGEMGFSDYVVSIEIIDCRIEE